MLLGLVVKKRKCDDDKDDDLSIVDEGGDKEKTVERGDVESRGSGDNEMTVQGGAVEGRGSGDNERTEQGGGVKGKGCGDNERTIERGDVKGRGSGDNAPTQRGRAGEQKRSLRPMCEQLTISYRERDDDSGGRASSDSRSRSLLSAEDLEEGWSEDIIPPPQHLHTFTATPGMAVDPPLPLHLVS